MTKNKHDHTATKKIKAWLFAIMLLLPFLFLLPTGLYYGLNQNAQLSERTETIETENYYEFTDSSERFNIEDLEYNKIYQLEFELNSNDDNFSVSFAYADFGEMNFSGDMEITIEDNQEYSLEVDSDNVHFYFWDKTYSYDNTGNNPIIVMFAINNNTIYGLDYINDNHSLNRITGYSQDEEIPNGTNSITTIESTNDISTSIINAWNSTWQNPLFSWTNYSPFYAPMQSFTNVFGINDMQIANVLTYLATITAIYIVFDIVIELFTYLTHLIPRSD